MKKNRPTNDLLTISEASKLLQCHPNTLRYWDRMGILKAIRFGKRGDRRFRKEDILKLINKKPSTKINYEQPDINFIKEELQISIERVGYFQYIINALSNISSPIEAADVIIQQGMRAFNAKNGTVSLLNKQNNLLEIFRTIDLKKKEQKTLDNIPVNAVLHITDAFRTGNVIFIESIEEGKIRYPLLTKMIKEKHIKAFAATPLIVNEKIFGVLHFSFTAARRFSEADRLFLQAITMQFAQTYERIYLTENQQHMLHELEHANKKIMRILGSILEVTQIIRIHLLKLHDEKSIQHINEIEEQTHRISGLTSNLLEQSIVRAKGVTYNDKNISNEEVVSKLPKNSRKKKSSQKRMRKEKTNK